MSQERRQGDSSTPSFSLDDITRLLFQPTAQHNPDNRSNMDAPPSNSDAPETEESHVETLCSVDDILEAPGRESLLILHPDCIGKHVWRDKTGKITKQILKMLKSDLPKPYPTYESLPTEIKNRWFRAFAQEFNWNPSITENVRTAYRKQAIASFKSNLASWKKTLKRKAADDIPDWMKAKKALFNGYMAMWRDAKVARTSAKNSANRKSERGGLGIAIHNNGAKTIERRWDEMTSANGGKEPDMVTFIDVMHTNVTTGAKDKKAVEIMAKVEEIVSQRQTQGEEPLSQAEINELVLQEVPFINGRRFGLGTLVDSRYTISSYKSTNAAAEDQLREEIETLKKDQKDKDAKIQSQDTQIQYLMQCNKLILEKFPGVCPPPPFPSATVEDDSETQP